MKDILARSSSHDPNPDQTPPPPISSNTTRRFARPRLLLAWLLILCFTLLIWQHQSMWAFLLLAIHGFVRTETRQERFAAFRRPEEWIPLTLFLSPSSA